MKGLSGWLPKTITERSQKKRGGKKIKTGKQGLCGMVYSKQMDSGIMSGDCGEKKKEGKIAEKRVTYKQVASQKEGKDRRALNPG